MFKYTYKHKLIQNIVHKPLLHKKGKRWIILGLSALVLLGLGSIGTVNADTVNSSISNPIHTSIQAKSMQNRQSQDNNRVNSNKSNNNSKFTVRNITQKSVNSNANNSFINFNIQKQANNLHQKITSNQNNCHLMQTDLVNNASSKNQNKDNQKNKIINANKIINTRPVGDTNPSITANKNFSAISFYYISDLSNPFDRDETYSDVVKSGDFIGSHFVPTTDSINQKQAQSILNGQVGNDYKYTVLFPGDKIGDTTVPNYSPKVGVDGSYILLLANLNIPYHINFHDTDNDYTVASYTYSIPEFTESHLLDNINNDVNDGKQTSEILDEIPNNRSLKQKLDGYKITGSSVSPNNVLTINVVPNTVSNTIFFQNNIKGFIQEHPNIYSEILLNGVPNSSFSVTNSEAHQGQYPLPSDWVMQNNTFFGQINHGNNTTTQFAIPVIPAQKTDTIDFVNRNRTIGHKLFTGNDYRTGIKGTVNITNNDLPSQYRLQQNLILNYNGQTYYIPVNRELTDTINYQYNNQNIPDGSFQYSGISDASDENLKEFYSHLSNQLPSGYSLASNAKDVFDSQYINDLQHPNGNDYNGKVINIPVIPSSALNQTGNININYKDNADNLIHTDTISKAINIPIDSSIISYISNHIPNSYSIKSINTNGVTKFTKNTQNIDVILNKNIQPTSYGNIVVNYVDSNNSFIGNPITLTNQINSNFDLNYFKGHIPTNYHLVQVKQGNNVNKYNDGTQNVVIEIAKNPTPVQPTQYGTITVNYVDSNNRIIGNSLTLNGAIGTSLDNNYFMQDVPTGYHYIGSSSANNNVKFNNSNQTVQFEVDKNNNPQPTQYGTITVSYIDNNGNSVNQSITLTSKDGSNFNSSYFMNNIPSGYHYVSQTKGNNVTSFNNGSQQVQFKIAKNNNNNTIINHYIPSKPKIINHTVYIPKYIPKIVYKKHNVVINHIKYVPKIISHDNIIYIPKTVYKYSNNMIYIPKVIDHTHTIYIPKIIYKNDGRIINHNRIIYEYKHYPHVSTLDNVRKGHTVRYHNNLVTRLHINEFRYFYITKTILTHRNLASIGNLKDYDYVLHPNHIHTFKINKMWLINHHNHFSIRYQFTYHGKTYFTTANQDYTRNAYYQSREFGSHTHKILIINNCIEYKKPHYNKKLIINKRYKGEILRIKRVIYINSHRNEMTRFELNNGHYITANKNYVKIIK